MSTDSDPDLQSDLQQYLKTDQFKDDLAKAKTSNTYCSDIYSKQKNTPENVKDWNKCLTQALKAQRMNYPGGSRRKSRKNKGGKKTKKTMKRKGGRRHRKSQRRSRR